HVTGVQTCALPISSDSRKPWSCHGVKGTTLLPLDLRADLLRDPLHVPRDLTAKVLRQGHERDRDQRVPVNLRPEVDPQAGVQATLELAHERVQRVDGAVQVDRVALDLDGELMTAGVLRDDEVHGCNLLSVFPWGTARIHDLASWSSYVTIIPTGRRMTAGSNASHGRERDRETRSPVSR